MEIERILAASMEEERQMKEFQMRQLKQSWADNAARKQMEKTQPPPPDFDLSNAGPASLQNMSGEDVDRYERIKKQREQMKEWIQQQIAEKEYSKRSEQEEDLNYAEMIKMIDEIRDATEKEEQEMRKYVINTVKADNLEVLWSSLYSFDDCNAGHHISHRALNANAPSSQWDRSSARPFRTP